MRRSSRISSDALLRCTKNSKLLELVDTDEEEQEELEEKESSEIERENSFRDKEEEEEQEDEQEKKSEDASEDDNETRGKHIRKLSARQKYKPSSIAEEYNEESTSELCCDSGRPRKKLLTEVKITVPHAGAIESQSQPEDNVSDFSPISYQSSVHQDDTSLGYYPLQKKYQRGEMKRKRKPVVQVNSADETKLLEQTKMFFERIIDKHELVIE